MSDAERNSDDIPSQEETFNALIRAATEGNLSRLKEHLLRIPQHGFERAWPLKNALHAACKANQVEIVTYLIDQENCNIDQQAPLVALSKRNFSILEAFQCRGWDINAPYQGGNTLSILWIAMLREDPLRWCLEHGAAPAMRSVGRNNQLLTKAGWLAPISSLEMLKQYGAEFTKSNALHEAAQKNGTAGCHKKMTWLLDVAGVDINQREWWWDDEYNRLNGDMGFKTALQCAVQARKIENVRFLLNRGADLEVRDTTGRRVAEMARELRFIEAFETFQIEGT